MSFETFVLARTLTLPPPFTPPPPPPHTHKKKKKKRFCQIRISRQFIIKKRATHTSTRSPLNFFLIWIICQLDSVLVIFLQIDKESIFFLGGGELWRGGGGRSEHKMYKCLNSTSTLQGIQMCQIILKYMLKHRRNSPDKLNLRSFYHLIFKCVLDL